MGGGTSAFRKAMLVFKWHLRHPRIRLKAQERVAWSGEGRRKIDRPNKVRFGNVVFIYGAVLVLIQIYEVRKHAVDWRKPLKPELQKSNWQLCLFIRYRSRLRCDGLIHRRQGNVGTNILGTIFFVIRSIWGCNPKQSGLEDWIQEGGHSLFGCCSPGILSRTKHVESELQYLETRVRVASAPL